MSRSARIYTCVRLLDETPRRSKDTQAVNLRHQYAHLKENPNRLRHFRPRLTLPDDSFRLVKRPRGSPTDTPQLFPLVKRPTNGNGNIGVPSAAVADGLVTGLPAARYQSPEQKLVLPRAVENPLRQQDH